MKPALIFGRNMKSVGILSDRPEKHQHSKHERDKEVEGYIRRHYTLVILVHFQSHIAISSENSIQEQRKWSNSEVLTYILETDSLRKASTYNRVIIDIMLICIVHV